MASAFGKGLATGFFRTLKDRVDSRDAAAEEFYAKQVERAMEIGRKVKGEAEQLASQGVTVAKQLEQAGVPKNIIMAIANQNPDELAGFQKTVNEAAMQGIPIDAEFFNDFVEVGAEFKPSDESWDSFFNRIYTPLAANIKADPKAFERDRKGGIMATMFGYNAMENAADRLSTTEIEGGMTAEQLLAYGDRVLPRKPLGEGTVTYDYGKLGEAERAAGASRRGPESLTDSERISYGKLWEDKWPGVIARLGFTDAANLTDEQRRQAEGVLYRELSKSYPNASSFFTTLMAFPEAAEEAPPEESPVEAPNSPVEGEEEQSAPVPAKTEEAPVEAPKTLTAGGGTWTFQRVAKDGNYIYKNQDGELRKFSKEQAEKYR